MRDALDGPSLNSLDRPNRSIPTSDLDTSSVTEHWFLFAPTSRSAECCDAQDADSCPVGISDLALGILLSRIRRHVS